MRLASRRTKWRTTSFQKNGLLIGSNALESLANGSGLRLGFRSSVYRTGMNDWSDEEIFDPINTDDLNLRSRSGRRIARKSIVCSMQATNADRKRPTTKCRVDPAGRRFPVMREVRPQYLCCEMSLE